MKLPLRSLLTCGLLTVACALASAQSFNLDSLNAFGNPSNAYGAAGAQPGFWTNVDGYGGLAPQSLNDIAGNPTAVTVDFASGTNFYSDNAATSGDDQALLDDVQDTGAGGATWIISGLAAGNYRVYAYAWAPDNPVYVTNVAVTGGSAGVQSCGGSPWSGTHQQGVTYVTDVVNGIPAGGSLQISFTVGAGFASVNGVQIVLLPPVPPPTTYCTAGTSTNGCVPSISATGIPSLAASSGFTINVTNVEGQRSGLVFYGISGASSAVWGSGSTSFLCVKAPTQRMTNQSSGGTNGLCDGLLSQDWRAWTFARPAALGQPFAAGNVVHAQAWYRDPSAVKTTNLSNGLKFTVAP